jgi:hypothetical protein
MITRTNVTFPRLFAPLIHKRDLQILADFQCTRINVTFLTVTRIFVTFLKVTSRINVDDSPGEL